MTSALVRLAGAELPYAAYRGGYALPAFNVANLETVQGVLNAAYELASPVILQVSPGAIGYAGYDAITQLVFHAADCAAGPVVVHLDHARDPEVVVRAIEDGYGSVMFDGSRLPYDENVRLTRSIVERARESGCAVEAEIGVIGGIEDTSASEALTGVIGHEEAAEFAAATGIDILAPALGSVHRMPDDSVELDAAVVRRISTACGIPLALHGGTGIKRSLLPHLVAAGIAKVNISSAVTRALARGIQAIWDSDPAQLDLRVFLASGRDEVSAVAADYMRACGSVDRAGERRLRSRPPGVDEPE